MSKPLLRWLLSSVVVSGGLFAAFAYFDSLQRGVGWGLLGLMAVTGIFGFSHCIATTPRNRHSPYDVAADYVD